MRDHHREIETLLHRYAEAIDAGDLALVDDRWVFRRRVMLPVLTCDLSHHLLIDLPSEGG